MSDNEVAAAEMLPPPVDPEGPSTLPLRVEPEGPSTLPPRVEPEGPSTLPPRRPPARPSGRPEQGRPAVSSSAELPPTEPLGGGARRAAPGSARARAEPPFPVPGWDRYQGVRLLGEGGMGRVYLAYDVRLRRHVALKFLRAETPELARRLVAEARAQARVDHERVCKVYEVGEVEGRPYVAMQYVDGRPLSGLVGELGVEQKALVVRDAAEGVHAAHRAGLIHRDVKPSNVLVERGEDGALKTYVMDFGLARDWRGEGMGTVAGAVLGTPHFMPPEQARGEFARLDRRADVYALGATLYYVLTGRPPAAGATALEVLANVVSAEPKPPRAIDPDLPAALEAVALKCLEKDRSARYDSARALAEELDRFLRGEPVLARPAGPLRRLLLRARRHKLLLAVAAASLFVVALSLGQAFLARRGAAERERLARRFAERVEYVKARARYVGLSRLHDTRGERRALREQMRALEAEIARAGPSAEGPGQAALGQAHLALGDDEPARGRLEAAWASGYREPEAAYALALATGRRYQRERLAAERLRDPTRREARLAEVERRLRDQALEYLRGGAGADLPSADYLEALVAFYGGRLDDALARLESASGAPPWFYEAPALRGDVLLARAMRAWNRGDRAPALADLEAGRQAYAGAAAVAESVPALHRGAAEIERAALLVELYGGGEVAPHAARALEAVARALAADPDDGASRLLEADLWRRLSEHRLHHGGDAEGASERALAAARAALALAPGDDARLELGRVQQHRAWLRQDRGLDPRAELAEAADALDAVSPPGRDYEYYSALGLVFKVWANHEDGAGTDAGGLRERAIEAYLSATSLDPRAPEALINLGIVYFEGASQPQAIDPEGGLAKASATLEKARALAPRHVVPYFSGGQVGESRAQLLRDRGQDPRPALEEALALFRQGVAINPSLPYLHNGLGSALVELARAEWDA
nr:protein kinase [Polyangiaceae bacterium]